MLTALILIPFLAALVVLVLPRTATVFPRAVALAATLFNLVLGLVLFLKFQPGGGFQFVQKIAWVPALGLTFHLAVDGLNIGLLLMGCIVAFAAVWVSW